MPQTNDIIHQAQVRESVENQILGGASDANGADAVSAQATCVVINYKACELPDAYKNMIYSRFLRSLRYGNDYFRLIDNDSYFQAYHGYIERLLSRPLSVVKLLVLSDDYLTVLGWSLVESNVLHYFHIQKDHRGSRLHELLIPKHIDTITHITRKGAKLWARDYPHLKFNPFI